MHGWTLLGVLLILLVCSTTYGFKPSASSTCLKSIFAGSVHNLYIDSPDTKLSCRRVAGHKTLGSKCGWNCLKFNTSSPSCSGDSFIVKRFQPLARLRSKSMASDIDKSGNFEGLGSVLHSAKLAMARCEQLLEIPIAEPVRWTTSTECNREPTQSKAYSEMLNRHSFSRSTVNSEDSEILAWRCNGTSSSNSHSNSTDSTVSYRTGEWKSLLIEGRSQNSRLIKILAALEREMASNLCREEENTLDNEDLAAHDNVEIAVGGNPRRQLTMLAQSPGRRYWRSLIVMDSLIGWMGLVLGISTLTCCAWRRDGRGCWWNFVCGCNCSRQSMPSKLESGSAPDRVVSDFSESMLQPYGRGTNGGRKQSAETCRVEPFSLAGLATATDGFSEKNKVGAGSFGSVYRGTLFDGRVVAIKRAEQSRSSNPQQRERTESARQRAFEMELQVLSRLHHKHLVNLLGFCDENNEMLLVYEFMTNGTLYEHLHSHRHSSRALLSWQTRIRVALQAARGIEYLHLYAEPPIIHRDIKSSNILLDARWSARVSDFGLSLLLSCEERDDESHEQVITTRGTAGTVGYVDPEYYRLRHLTTKSDVYSFGVVIMELLTGRKAIFRRGAGYAALVDYAVPSIEADELKLILDPRVPPPTISEIAALKVMADVGKECVMLLGRDRPSMTEVIRRLEHAVTLCRPPDASLHVFGTQIGSTSELSGSTSESKSDHTKKSSSGELYIRSHDTTVTELGSHEFEAVLDSVREIEIPEFDVHQLVLSSSNIYAREGEGSSSNVLDRRLGEFSGNVLPSQPAVRFPSNVFDAQRSSSLLDEMEETNTWWHQLQLRLTMAGFDFSSGRAAAVEGDNSDDPPSQGSAVAGFARFGDSGPAEDIFPRAPQRQPSRWQESHLESPRPPRVPAQPSLEGLQQQPAPESPQPPQVQPQSSLERPQTSRVQAQSFVERTQSPQMQRQPSLERSQPSLGRQQLTRLQTSPARQQRQSSMEIAQHPRLQPQQSMERTRTPRPQWRHSLERTQSPRVQRQTSVARPQPARVQWQPSPDIPQTSRVQRQSSLEREQSSQVQWQLSLDSPQPSRVEPRPPLERSQPSPMHRQPSQEMEGELDERLIRRNNGSNSGSSTMSMSLFEGEGVSDIDNVDIEEFLDEYLEPRRTEGTVSFAGYSVHEDLEELIRALEQDYPLFRRT